MLLFKVFESVELKNELDVDFLGSLFFESIFPAQKKRQSNIVIIKLSPFYFIEVYLKKLDAYFFANQLFTIS